MTVEIIRADNSFSNWPALLALLQGAFSYMGGRIDPPSSLRFLSLDSIAVKARNESLFLATENEELVGCVFVAPQSDFLYVGKLAIHPEHQRKGIGRCLMQTVERYAIKMGIDTLELNTRIELTENHTAFKSMGFLVTGEHSHEGYNRPTFISMRKVLG